MLSQEFFASIAPTMFKDVRWFPKIDSTNQYLMAEARGEAPHGTVVVADYQAAGRGRRDRTWVAVPGEATLASILLRGPYSVRDGFWLSAAVVLSVVDACRQLNVDTKVKWPNDVVLNGRKLCGVLGESIVSGSQLDAVVVGFGLNVGPTVPPGMESTATTLSAVTGNLIGRESVLARVLLAADRRLADFDADMVMKEFTDSCATIGQAVRIEGNGEIHEGMATGVTDEGQLVVDTAEGQKMVAVGDVIHVRSVDT